MAAIIYKDLILREFMDSDSIRLTELCNNKKIWDNVRDSMPYPYTLKDAESFIKICHEEKLTSTMAIDYKSELAGCIGLLRQSDVYRLSAELGYWIGEPYWNQGIASMAVNRMVEYGFNVLGLVRIYSGVFDFNKASQRVLEKAGFKLDCIYRNAVIKNGKICDEYRYGKIKM